MVYRRRYDGLVCCLNLLRTVRLDFLSENKKLKLSFIFSTMFSLILNLGFAVCLCQREEGSCLISFNERFSDNSSQLFDYFIKHTDVYTIWFTLILKFSKENILQCCQQIICLNERNVTVNRYLLIYTL